MSGNNTPNRSKVANLIEKYDLTGLGDELERLWTRDEDRYSLRQLSDHFNNRLLRSALEAEGAGSLDGEIENFYRLLTDDDVTSGTYLQARSRIERHGVDVDALESDFVSYQAIRTYLRKQRNADAPDESRSPAEQRDAKRETIQRLVGRLTSVTEKSLRELVSGDLITLGDFTVIVTVRVHCSDCDVQRSVTDLIESGGCQCER